MRHPDEVIASQLPPIPGIPLAEALEPPDYPRELERRQRLEDGRVYAVRPLVPADQPALKSALELADPQTLYQRFFTTQPRLDTKSLSRLTHLDYRQRMALLAMTPSRSPVAIARYEANAGSDRAEVSFVVAPSWRDAGLAQALEQMLEEAARARGIRVFDAYYLADNEPAAGLFARCCYGSPRVCAGVAEVEKILPHAERGRES